MPIHALADTLDASQRKRATAAADDVLAAALDTSPMDRDACRSAIHRAYAHLGLAAPDVRFFDSPIAAMSAMQRLLPRASEPAEPGHRRAVDDILGDLGAWVAGQMGAARPRRLSGLGREIDISFNGELNHATDALVRRPGWSPLARLVDRRLGDLVHHAHAVDDRLEAQVDHRDHVVLLYSSGAACLWRFAEHYARVQALVAIGALDVEPPELSLGRDVLAGCGWINAFEKVCLVCERPQSLAQEGRPRDDAGLRTRVTWRDGQVCEAVHRA